MRIPCPFCGSRDIHEFIYRGDGNLARPVSDEAAFYEYVYLRNNPAGQLAEHWYHANGCRNWLLVMRNTLTHKITSAVLARGMRR